MEQLLENINCRSIPFQVWRVIDGTNNKHTDASNTHEAITKQSNPVSFLQKRTVQSLKFTPCTNLYRLSCFQIVRRTIHKQSPSSDSSTPFTPNITKIFANNLKPIAVAGPDSISFRHLNLLGPVVIRALNDIISQIT